MKKYITAFQLSFQNEFVYRLNFILWRFRNVLRILMTYFLWSTVFLRNDIAFGYTKEQMITYVFLVLIISSFVMSAPSNDNIGGEISNGDLSNYLIKPVSYLRYWLTRDLASKLLNIIFAIFEVSILWIIFKPHIYFSTSPLVLVFGILALAIATIIYFLITKLAVMIAFWSPENTWGPMFTLLVFMEILSGAIFPLNILPNWAYIAVQFTPFPYLIYFPIGILVGKFGFTEIVRIFMQSLIWLTIGLFLVKKMWKSGLKTYSAYGK